MQIVSFWISIWVAKSNSYDDNHYATKEQKKKKS